MVYKVNSSYSRARNLRGFSIVLPCTATVFGPNSHVLYYRGITTWVKNAIELQCGLPKDLNTGIFT